MTYGPPKGSNTSLCSGHPREDTLDPQIQYGSWVPEFGALLGATRRPGSLTTGLAGSWENTEELVPTRTPSVPAELGYRENCRQGEAAELRSQLCQHSGGKMGESPEK